MGFHHLRDVRALSHMSRDSLGGGGAPATGGGGAERRTRQDSQSSNKKDSLSLRAPNPKQSGSNLTAFSAMSASTQMLVTPIAHMAAIDARNTATSPYLPAKCDTQTPSVTPQRQKLRSNSCKTRRRDSRRSDRSVLLREQSSDFRLLIDAADSEMPQPQVIPPTPIAMGRPLGGAAGGGRAGRHRCETVPGNVCDMESSLTITEPLLSCSVGGLEQSGKLLESNRSWTAGHRLEYHHHYEVLLLFFLSTYLRTRIYLNIKSMSFGFHKFRCI